MVFLTKSGDAELFLELEGVDYECRDAAEIDAFTKRSSPLWRCSMKVPRLSAALQAQPTEDSSFLFGQAGRGCRDPQRVAYFAARAEDLFSLSIYFVVLCPALAARRSLAGAILEFPENPGRSMAELRARFSSTASVG